MWYEIFKFEIQYRAKRLDTYIFFVFLFLFSLVGVDFIFHGVEMGLIKKNAPITIAKTMGALTGISVMIASLIMGVPVLRDFKYNMESLQYINPIHERDYLIGRFLGSFLVLLFAFSGLLLGLMLGEYMPWRTPEDLLPFNFLAYIQPFFTVVLPTLFFSAAVFFVSGALSRKLIVVYTQWVFIFVVFMLTKSITNEFLQAILDPLSLTTLTDMVDGWTAVERNENRIPFNGVLLYNKLFWVAIGVLILWYGYHKFNFNVVKEKSTKKKKKKKRLQVLDEQNKPSGFRIKIPSVTLQYDFKAQCIQLIRLTWFYFMSICKQTSFWAIVICGMIIILINSVSLGTVYGVDSYPKTYFIIGELQEMSIYFFVMILIFYSGELIWKEREAQLHLIYDATPIADFVGLSAKFLGLLLVYIVLIVSLILSGVMFQTASGYYNYEFDVYFYGFFLELFPFLVLYTFISFFFQVIANNKFIGFVLVMVFFIINVASEALGFEHDLYKFGGGSLGTYSDMNGYGHFLVPFLWIKTYWMVFGFIILLISAVFSVRGVETSLKRRWKLCKQRVTKPVVRLAAFCSIVFVGIGSYIFYNTNILNEYWNSTHQQEYRAGYEKALKQFEYIPQPKITDVNLKVELYPENRAYTAEGYYILKNTQNQAIDEIHLQKLIDANVNLAYITLDRNATIDSAYKKYDYYVYTLNPPLKPGDSVKMTFKQVYTTSGFEEGSSNTEILHNGTFFTNKDFPSLGYNKKYELRENRERKEYGLEAREQMAKRNNPMESTYAMTGGDADQINFEIVLGTDKDQKAIAPGSLIRDWKEGERAYFHYKMKKPMINFYSIVSARYEVIQKKWLSQLDSLKDPIDLEIYYHKGHEYNLNRMMESMEMSLDYFGKNFSPYQYQQMRILEFPRYAEFAQSFPNTIPFSEALGFVLDIDDEKDVDMAFYVTAHEVAHQWWGMQVEAANVQGRHMILETLAQYSALMVLKQRYPKEKIEQFLQMELDAYKKGKLRDDKDEVPLEFVEKQDYIYYRKGGVNMYALQECIGEQKINLALRRFIKDWNSTNGRLKLETERYTKSNDLLGYFREVTPGNLQYVIKDLFETVTPLKLLH